MSHVTMFCPFIYLFIFAPHPRICPLLLERGAGREEEREKEEGGKEGRKEGRKEKKHR